ncbi:hypothetical protein [Nocardiopsis composta]|uniref:Uncharacterized protein n=1 Tax=Nocardiopsis composta TaxID=157465 RepID=A0A7W8VC81_9ACTN|nr:hypothetical protein [Nocardiopsis composta]MBB5430690.1 hypothetical protein [Nocardiopsis composta]
MSPKKKNKNKRTRPAGPRTAPTPHRDRRDGESAAETPRRRTPVPLDGPPRWPIALWSGLTALWLIGSALFFVLILAEGLALMGETDPAPDALHTTALYLLGLIVCALAVPAAGAVTAALLRRRIAAAMFALATTASAIALFSLGSPAQLLDALRGGLG